MNRPKRNLFAFYIIIIRTRPKKAKPKLLVISSNRRFQIVSNDDDNLETHLQTTRIQKTIVE